MSGFRVVLVALIAIAAPAAVGPATVSAQEDTTLEIVVTTPGGDPVSDATLTAVWEDGSNARTTQSNGRAFISVPDGADVEIRVEHPDYVRNFPLDVEDASEREVEMTVHEKASIEVTVEDGDGSVADAQVTFRKDGQRVASGSSSEAGVVDSGTVESGEYAVIVSKAGYHVASETVEASGDVSEEVRIRRGTVTLEVNVTDDHFDPPRAVDGVTVDVAQSGSVRTQPTGVGRIGVPVNTWLTVEAGGDDYESTSTSTFVRESDTTLNLTVRRTSSLSAELLSDRVVPGENVLVEVTDEYGDPVAGASVLLDGEAVAETDDEGRAVVEVPSAGEHTVEVEHDGLSTEPQTVVGVDGSQNGTTSGGSGDATDGTEDSSVDLPGFGPVVALLALLALAGIGLRRGRV